MKKCTCSLLIFSVSRKKTTIIRDAVEPRVLEQFLLLKGKESPGTVKMARETGELEQHPPPQEVAVGSESELDLNIFKTPGFFPAQTLIPGTAWNRLGFWGCAAP